MRFFTALLLSLIAVTSSCFAQEEKDSKSVANSSNGPGDVSIVHLTEFRLKKPMDESVSTNEILKSLSEMKDNGEVEVIETIRLSALPTYESMVQIGKKATVTVGVMRAPGGGQNRTMQQQAIGTMVRVTAEPVDGKTRLKLSYEASRFEGEGTNESPPDTKTFQINTTLLLERSKTVLVGGSSADSSTFLAVSIH